MPSFTFTPDFGATRAAKPNARNVKFGDGYEQRIATGLNPVAYNWNVRFGNRDADEGNQIDAFLASLKGVDAFDWTPPYGAPGKFKCQDWSYVIEGVNRVTIAGTFEMVFEP